MTLQVVTTPATEQPRTVIWIDSRAAILARWDGTVTSVTHIQSDVPVHRRSTGHVMHNPTIAHGGGVAPRSDGEGRRLEHLAHFLRTVADRLDPFDALDITGPGTVHERLAALVRGDDDSRHRDRSLTVSAAAPMTRRQILARLRSLAGISVPRGRRPWPLAAPRRRRLQEPPLPDEELG